MLKHKNKHMHGHNHVYRSEILYPSQNHHLRCVMCNSVSSGEIAGDTGGYKSGAFFTDPNDSGGYLCYECFMSVEDQMSDYDLEDEYDED